MKHLRLLASFCFFMLIACDSSDVEDAIDIIDVPRKDIDVSRLGLNAFVNDGRFGTIREQFLEVRDTLDVHFVRVLFNWDSRVQSSPGAALDLGFYDEIVASIPQNIDAIAVLTGLPNWMNDPANWINGDPRLTFVEKFVRPIITRYAGNGRLIGFQIWNEPNMVSNPNNGVLGLSSAANYGALLRNAFNVARQVAPSKIILNAATTAINQNYPETLVYNEDLVMAGALNSLDVYAIHYYGKQYENLVRDGGIADFLNGLGKEIWLTESGAQGVNNQLAYGEEVWPFLIDKVPAIRRIYCYQFTEDTPADVTYGLRNLTPGLTVSDLYVHLRDR